MWCVCVCVRVCVCVCVCVCACAVPNTFGWCWFVLQRSHKVHCATQSARHIRVKVSHRVCWVCAQASPSSTCGGGPQDEEEQSRAHAAHRGVCVCECAVCNSSCVLVLYSCAAFNVCDPPTLRSMKVLRRWRRCSTCSGKPRPTKSQCCNLPLPKFAYVLSLHPQRCS